MARYTYIHTHSSAYYIYVILFFYVYIIGGIPQDGSPVDVISKFSLIVVGIIYTFSLAGIVFTLVCFGFNVIFRKRK